MRQVQNRTPLWILAALALCSSVATGQEFGKVVYNRYNIHYLITPGKRGLPTTYQASCLGNVGSGDKSYGFLPANTKVVLAKDRIGLKITTQDAAKRKITVYFSTKYMNNMTIEEYAQLIFSPTEVNHQGLNKMDLDGIRRGWALQGMSRTGVLVALGYPSIHRTNHMDEDVWTYWKDRSKTWIITFKDGKVDTIKHGK